MTLLKEIRRKRSRKGRKQPIGRTLFNRISSIVKKYTLKDRFLNTLDDVQEYFSSNDLSTARAKVKEPMEFPLFSLVTQEQYLLTVSIIRRVENPYLAFVQSPEEILLCKYLYRLNPSIPEERLKRFHFETLVLNELHTKQTSYSRTAS